MASTPLKRVLLGALARMLRKWANLIAPEGPPTSTVEAAKGQAMQDRPLGAEASRPSGGPPPHWVERVRQGAPGLLERPEEGGVPTQFAAEAGKGEEPSEAGEPVPRPARTVPRALQGPFAPILPSPQYPPTLGKIVKDPIQPAAKSQGEAPTVSGRLGESQTTAEKETPEGEVHTRPEGGDQASSPPPLLRRGLGGGWQTRLSSYPPPPAPPQPRRGVIQ